MKHIFVFTVIYLLGIGVDAQDLIQKKNEKELPECEITIVELFEELGVRNSEQIQLNKSLNVKITDLEGRIRELERDRDHYRKEYLKYSDDGKIAEEMEMLKRQNEKLTTGTNDLNNQILSIEKSFENEKLIAENSGREKVLREMEGFYLSQTFDELIQQTQVYHLRLHRNLFKEKGFEKVLKVIDGLLIYFEVHEEFNDGYNPVRFKLLLENLSSISQNSIEVEKLSISISKSDYDIQQFEVMLKELDKYNKAHFANDSNTYILKRAGLYQIVDYFCFNINYRSEQWRFMNNMVIDLRRRISEDPNIDISDLINKFD